MTSFTFSRVDLTIKIHSGFVCFMAFLQCDQIGRFLQVLGNKMSQKSSPNILVTFRAISYNVTIMYKVRGYFLGNFGGKLGNFIFHHLVTLLSYLPTDLWLRGSFESELKELLLFHFVLMN